VPISWNEIRNNAIEFSKEWVGETREHAEAKSFWDEFFAVFGLRRRTVASFEAPVKKLSDAWGFIDLFWKGILIVEHKSRGKDLGKAKSQAMDYIQGLTRDGRENENPRYIVLSDFAHVALHDLEEGKSLTFPLEEFHQHIHDFAFIPGYKQHSLEAEDPINIKAVEILGKVRDELENSGYQGRRLERFLVRILFCLFAEDTGIFERNAFSLYIENTAKEDGSDLGLHLAKFFDVLNTPNKKRLKHLDELLAALPFVNGDLFIEWLGFADLNRSMRDALLACGHFDWSRISPAIFGSLFQSVMEPKERRQIGGHYTSEKDIMKVVSTLFLNELKDEFKKIKTNKRRLKEFHQKLGTLSFLDPACGCGNFLVITYRELRLLEIEVLLALHGNKQRQLDIQHFSLVNVDSFYGIEIAEFPARIAEVAIWLMDHQMNIRLSEAFGQYFVRLPLSESATIVNENAFRIEWSNIIPKDKCDYILGNPPFVGKYLMIKQQREDMKIVWGKVKGAGVLDYVTAWYYQAAKYIQETDIKVGFVSTNSISQGEQVGVLWNTLFGKFNIKIHFAHRTFKWESEARGKAHVHVVIIGFGCNKAVKQTLFEYSQKFDQVTELKVGNINPYLIEGPDIIVNSRTKPICDVPKVIYGSKPADGGNLIIEDKDKKQFLKENPSAKQFIKPLICAQHYLHNIPRWCLWLVNASPSEIQKSTGTMRRIEKVRKFRQASKKLPTQEMANQPSVFAEIRQPTTRYILVPRHTSENRKYIPFGYFGPDSIVHDSCSSIENASLFHFGVISSKMHMAWVKNICGRIKSDYRYSNKLVYNNYPWPDSVTKKQTEAVEKAATNVLNVREKYPDSSLADLYDPILMPPDLVKAHGALDKAVDKCYRSQPFKDERQRMEFLFGMYERLTAPLMSKHKTDKLK